jgi:restriction endonuclease S subunit
LIIGSGGNASIHFDNKFSCSGHNFVLKVKDNEVDSKYVYYYLLNNIGVLEKGFSGVAIKNISKEYINNIKIPILDKEHQKEIVEFLDNLFKEDDTKIKNYIAYYENNDIFKLLLQKKYNTFENLVKWQQQDIELHKQIQFFKNRQKIYINLSKNGDIKTLGEICKVNQGTYIKSDIKIQGEYPVYGGGNVSYYINQYNREDEIIVAKDGVSADCVRYEKNKFFLNHHGWTIICKDVINKKYMFYYLQSIQPELLSIAKGIAQLGINQENFYKLKIPIPSLERQKEIVEYCERNDKLIEDLEKEIKENKKLAEQFITNILES